MARRSTKPCTVDGCDKFAVGRGLCSAHWQKWRKYGDPAMPSQRGTHGLSRSTPEYRAWINMKSRCYNPGTPGFDRYGGRGITVCDEWRENFEVFFANVGHRPSPEHSLDRWPDPDGNYEPNNTRWATREEQSRNICTNRIVEIAGISVTLAEAVETSGLLYNTVLYRLKRGWSLERALTREPHKGVRP
jgi:hypothetical protein